MMLKTILVLWSLVVWVYQPSIQQVDNVLTKK